MPDYGRLAAHLAAQDEPRVTLTFEHVEAIIGGPLPWAARRGHGWWGKHPMGQRYHGCAWLRVGWRVERVDHYAGAVTFIHDGEEAPHANNGLVRA